MSAPDVTFLMPCAAPAPYLEEALKSLIAQSHASWELVLVLDGPAPIERAIAESMIPREQLIIVQNAKRLGIARALNLGLSRCRSEFVARIDSDDVCSPERLQVQIDFMRLNPECHLVGAGASLIDKNGIQLGQIQTQSIADLRRGLLVRNQLVHSGAFFRASDAISLGGYHAHCHLREDYDLWLRFATLGPIFNVPEDLIGYRVSDHQISRGFATSAAKRIVRASRIEAAEAIVVCRLKAEFYHFAWSVAQSKIGGKFRIRVRKR